MNLSIFSVVLLLLVLLHECKSAWPTVNSVKKECIMLSFACTPIIDKYVRAQTAGAHYSLFSSSDKTWLSAGFMLCKYIDFTKQRCSVPIIVGRHLTGKMSPLLGNITAANCILNWIHHATTPSSIHTHVSLLWYYHNILLTYRTNLSRMYSTDWSVLKKSQSHTRDFCLKEDPFGYCIINS